MCRQLWCTTRRGYPCQISSHSKRRNVKNCQGPTREPDRKATPPIKTVPWKTGFTCFLNERVLQKAVKRSLDNSIQRRKCLQDRKLFGGKRWNIKTAKKLSFIGKWPDYSRNMNLSTQNSIARLCTKFFFDLLFTRHYNGLKELVWFSKISSDSHRNYNPSSNELLHV